MPPIFILGMHRSGTSFLARSLHEYGLHLPDASQNSSPFNQNGNYEKREIVIFHENLLQKNHGSWSRPPQTIQWKEQHIKRAEEFLQQLNTIEPSGFKDPRTLLHIKQWESLITPQYIGIFRHPSAVAKSLNARDKISLVEAEALWQHYNAILLDLWKNAPFPLINFDSPSTDLLDSIKKAAIYFNLPNMRKNVHTLDSALKHHTHKEITNPKVKKLYDSLVSAASTNSAF